MKSFATFILAALCVTVLCPQVEMAENPNKQECMQKHNVSADEVKKVMTGDIKPTDVTPNMKCYFLCVSEKEGVTKDGVFQAQVIADKLAMAPNKDEAAKGIAACKDTKGTDNCDTAFKLMACLIKGKASYWEI